MACRECPLEQVTLTALDVVRENPDGILSSAQRREKMVTLTARSAIIEKLALGCEGPRETGDCPNTEVIEQIERAVLSPDTYLQTHGAQQNTTVDKPQTKEE